MSARLSQQQRALLLAVVRGEITYHQFTGGYGSRYETSSGDRVSPRVEALQRRGLIAWVPLKLKMGGPVHGYTIKLTDAGRDALATIDSHDFERHSRRPIECRICGQDRDVHRRVSATDRAMLRFQP